MERPVPAAPPDPAPAPEQGPEPSSAAGPGGADAAPDPGRLGAPLAELGAQDAPLAVGDPGAPDTGSTRRDRLFEGAAARGVPLAAILTVAGVAVAVYVGAQVVYRLRQIILLVLVAGFVALLLNPIVVVLQRFGHLGLRRRGMAVGVTAVAALLVFVGLATAFGYPMVNAVTHFLTHLSTYVDQAERGKGWIGRLIRRYHISRFVRQNAPKIEGYARSLAKPALTLGKGAATLVVAMVAIFMLVLLTLLEGPKLRQGASQLVPARYRSEVFRVASQVNRSVTGYMLGNFVTSLIAGIVVFVTMTILGLPYAPLWGLWVGVVDFLPMIGGALAGIPAVLFGFVAGGVLDGVVLLVVFVVYSQVENHVLNPVVMSKTVRISPLLVLLAVLVGAELGDLVGGVFGGFVGTLLAIPLAGSAQVIVVELWRLTARPGAAGPGSPGSVADGQSAPFT